MMANAANPEDEYEPSKLIDGKAIAAQIRLEVAEAVIKLADTSVRDGGPPIVPGLAVILGRDLSSRKSGTPHMWPASHFTFT